MRELYAVYNSGGIDAFLSHMIDERLDMDIVRESILSDKDCPMSESDKVFYACMDLDS